MRMVQYSKYITITLHNDLIVLDIYCILVVFISCCMDMTFLCGPGMPGTVLCEGV